MRKQFIVICVLVVLMALLTAVAETTWTCEFCNKKNGGRFCTSCGRSKEEAIDKKAAACFHGDHDWLPATMYKPETCSRCGATRGESIILSGAYTFGHYEQDNDVENGQEPIEWIILEKKQDGSLILLSKYVLDFKPYNTTQSRVTWEKCSLRVWLNSDFYDTAFSAEEKLHIVSVTNINDKNPNNYTSGGNNTVDNVWLLSIAEVKQYFSADNERICEPTEYSGSLIGERSSRWWPEHPAWWLRSPGITRGHAAIVDRNGDVNVGGHEVNNLSYRIGVRPVICVKPSE